MPLYSGPVKMLVTPHCGASSNIALWRAYCKTPVELVVADLDALPMGRKENKWQRILALNMEFRLKE